MRILVPVTALSMLLASALLPACAGNPDSKALQTAKGPVALHIIQHASFVLDWNDKTVYFDPVGPADQYKGLGAPDIVFITHAHGDHLSPDTLKALDTRHAIMVMPQSVAEKIGDQLGKTRVVMANGDSAEKLGIKIQAMPMYNLPPSKDAYHPKGWGNGYVLTLGNKRVYISGDTEGIPEMRALKNIDLAFVCMNLPYTMDVEHAADAVLAFKPKVVYPYHYRGQDTEKFKQLVEQGSDNIEVRLRDWYQE